MGLSAVLRGTPAFVTIVAIAVGCGGGAARDAERTFALVESVRPVVSVVSDGDTEPLLGRTRLAEGDRVETDETGRASVVLDTGALVILAGGSNLEVTKTGAHLHAGRAWIDVEEGADLHLETEKGQLTARGAGFGVEVARGRTVAYVAQGEALWRAGGKRGLVRSGQSAVLAGGEAEVTNQDLWDDWTGGLAVPGPREVDAEGVGEIYARLPDQSGQARWPLVIRNLDVRVRIEGDLAVTEVDQVFFNPASETVEGLYRIRTPEGALLQRFAVDRAGQLVESIVKEQALARRQYQEQVYAGSTEDPALLEWEAPDAYRARIYPIEPGASRRIVIRYAQWIGRSGEVRRYRYPIGRGPRMQEMSIEVNLSGAGAESVRANLGARVTTDRVLLYKSDYQPTADFWVDLVGSDRSPTSARGYRAEHEPPVSTEMQPDRDESDYLLTQLFPVPEELETPESLDVVLLVDLSAGTDATRLELARQFVDVTLRHLEERDRLAVVAADLGMHAIADRPTRLEPATTEHKEAILDALAREPAGGATDLGAALADAAALLDATRPGAVVYVGDAIPTVGELDLPALLERLARLPRPPRLYGVAVGQEARLDLLEGLVRGAGLAVRVEGRKEAAEAALRVLSHLSRPVITDVTVDLGSGIDRVYPRSAVSVVVGEPLDVVGRVRDDVPKEVVVRAKSGGKAFERRIRLDTKTIADSGDLRLRWASERLRQLLAEGGGREAIAEVGTRYGLLTPFTSFYVPSASDLARDPELQRLQELRRQEELRRQSQQSYIPPYPRGNAFAYGCMGRAMEDRAEPTSEEVPVLPGQSAPQPPPVAMPATPASEAQQALGGESGDEGGKGRRMKGEEGRMGDFARDQRASGAYGIQGPADREAQLEEVPAEERTRAEAPAGSTSAVDALAAAPEPEAAENDVAAPAMARRAARPAPSEDAFDIDGATDESEASGVLGALAGSEVGENFGYGGMGLRGTGVGGGGTGEGTIGLGNLDTIGHGGGGGSGSGYGRGAGGLRGAETGTPMIRPGAAQVRGSLSSEVIRRVIRTHQNEVKFCYEQQLAQRPDLAGRVDLNLIISPTGAVQSSTIASSTLGNAPAEQCVANAGRRWAFPAPEGGGIVVVRYPFMFQTSGAAEAPTLARARPGSSSVGISWLSGADFAEGEEDAQVAQRTTSIVVVATDADDTPHRSTLCSPASRQTLRARRALWRERLSQQRGVAGALRVWRQALWRCEVPRWRDRRALLTLLLDVVGGPRNMVALHQAFVGDAGTQAFLRREILSRVRSAEDLRIVHEGLGQFGSVDWEAVETLLSKAPDLRTKVGVARDLLRRWPDDLRLKVQLFGLFDEAREDREARRLAGEIRADEYADMRARTLVGEYYLRKGDEAAAKRTWSEIVEFAPFDPYARRWLGDLYRAAGWHEEAYRQYETLASLTPDDEGVQILLAAAAAGAGRVDEALRLESKVASASEPGSAEGDARFALLWSGVRLAQMRAEARRANDTEKLQKLVARANRSGTLREAGAFRAVLTWSHPDSGLELWTAYPESPFARPEDLGSHYGIEAWNVERLWPGAMKLEVRQTTDPGMREVKAVLWLIWKEGKDDEVIESFDLVFGRNRRAAAFSMEGGRATPTESSWTPGGES